ncbi:MAG TPA: c-type cytochrome [Paracoccaceae bacterium]|nr:c-type cytochrome [Paracoccaceae bacterium]
MKQKLALAAVVAAFAAPAFAQGNAENGPKLFNQCQTCHVVQNEAGEVLAGRNAKTGPNLYGVVGRQAGSVEGFRYQASIVEAGAAGLVWDETELTAYLVNPTDYLKARLDNPRARSGMTHRVRSETDAADLAAFLATFGAAPAAAAPADGAAAPAAPAAPSN